MGTGCGARVPRGFWARFTRSAIPSSAATASARARTLAAGLNDDSPRGKRCRDRRVWRVVPFHTYLLCCHACDTHAGAQPRPEAAATEERTAVGSQHHACVRPRLGQSTRKSSAYASDPGVEASQLPEVGYFAPEQKRGPFGSVLFAVHAAGRHLEGLARTECVHAPATSA
jgi:hypothetical protein